MTGLQVGLLGEVQPHRENPETAFAELQPLIDEVDVSICQLETSFSTSGSHTQEVAYPGHQVDPENVNALTAAGIDVVTFGSNTAMEYGGESMMETVELLRDNGIEVAGVGEDLADAREPVYVEQDGATLAVVNACSALNVGDPATEDSPGVFALKGESYSVQPDVAPGNENPGMQEVQKSTPRYEDMQRVGETVREASEKADHVVTTLHWGVPWVHDITYFQTDVAYGLIEAGADTIVGTHPHNLQPIDSHEGRPIFYSMANCVFDEPNLSTDDYTSSFVNYYDMWADEDVENYLTPRHTRDGIFVNLGFDGKGAAPDVDVTPVHINEEADPEPASLEDEDGQRIFAVLEAISGDIGVTLGREDDAIVIEDVDADAREAIRERVLSFPWTYKLREEVYLDRDFSFGDWYY